MTWHEPDADRYAEGQSADRDTAEPWRDDSDAALAELRACMDASDAARLQLERDVAEARGLVRAAENAITCSRFVRVSVRGQLQVALARWDAEQDIEF